MGGACGLEEEEIDGVKKEEEKNYCTWVSVSMFVHVSVYLSVSSLTIPTVKGTSSMLR